MTENTTNIMPVEKEGFEGPVEFAKKRGFAVTAIVFGVAGLVGLGIHMVKKHRAKKLNEEALLAEAEEIESSLDELLNSVEEA